MSDFQPRLGAVTLFAEDLATTKAFYTEIFGLPVTWEDDVSVVFLFGETMVNLLQVSEAPGLIAPVAVASPDAGARFQFTIHVTDVDATCAELTGRGAKLLNGPMDRPWGIRTALIADPAGHLWEIATKA
ncbi:VOC family protein [Tenggerimyces flavus]|uniref:VOC family protein n=1 Tax=Tenggerimyces flavus TaxID=1708749 RepID=A0ABV7YG01_9ACTN|nr:glyoxalase superfamily protein [Tenggerimyces flavus]MBM7787908.1 catechol 2,3-dioxygenase-like lactoylglutathione lyase family enzyme [Tenggerimyces flavus]